MMKIKHIVIIGFIMIFGLNFAFAEKKPSAQARVSESAAVLPSQQDDNVSRMAERADYLFRNSELNAKWIGTIATIISCLVAIIAVAFFSILIFLVNELRKIHQERKLNETAVAQIADHENTIAIIKAGIEDIRNQIRDASLREREKSIGEEEYVKFVKDILKQTPNVHTINFLKNLIWRENATLSELEPIVQDHELLRRIKDAYEKNFSRSFSPSQEELISGAYEIKKKGKTIDDLIRDKKTTEELIQAMISRQPKPGPQGSLGLGLFQRNK